MAKRHQLFLAGHRLQQLFPRATIAAEPELSEDRRRYHQRGGTQHDGHIPLPAGLRGIQLAAIKGDKNYLRDGGLSGALLPRFIIPIWWPRAGLSGRKWR